MYSNDGIDRCGISDACQLIVELSRQDDMGEAILDLSDSTGASAREILSTIRQVVSVIGENAETIVLSYDEKEAVIINRALNKVKRGMVKMMNKVRAEEESEDL